jgi:hypothetical protein
MDTRLRVGLLLDSVFLPLWAFTAIERLVRSHSAELALVIWNQSQPKRGSTLTALWQNRSCLLYSLFSAIDQKLFVRGQNALTPVNSSEIFSKVPALQVKPVNEEGRQRLCASDIEKIKSYQLDILVKIGFENLGGDVLSAAKYGMWTYRWGDARKIEDGLTGFWEVVDRWPETGAALQQLGTDGEHHQTLFESWYFTYPYSPARSRNYVLWSAASFLPRQVERLHRLGAQRYFQEIKRDDVSETSKHLKSNEIPSNITILWISARLAARNLLEIYRRSFLREQWGLLFRLGQDNGRGRAAFQKISPPNDRFWADPQVVFRAPNYYVFVEEYIYQKKRGHIAVIEMDGKGNYKPPVPILQEDCHLSFPFVFDWKGHYYMVPETSAKRTIELYECSRFPDQWQFKTRLMKEVNAVDTTLFYLHDKWWLFTAIAEEEAAAPQFELFLFYSDELFTDQWHAHPMNPIVSDVKRARAAGSIFVKDGILFRPSQDCSKAYGYGFDLNEIVALSETEYCEKTMISVRPDQLGKILATHTYAVKGNLTVMDVLTRQWKWAKTA